MSSRYSVLYCRKELDRSFQEVSISFESPEFDDQDLTEFSAEHGDVIYVAEQENVGFIHYEHWQHGRLVRRLKYNDDYAWLAADGEPEQWERDEVFSPENLSKTLACYDSERHEEIHAAWQRKRIQAGDTFPVLGLLNIIHILRQYWDLPN